MAWIIYFTSAILNVRSRRLAAEYEDSEKVLAGEAQLIYLIFECLSGHDNYIAQRGSDSPRTI